MYSELRLGKAHKVGESRQCFARDEIHPSSYVLWVELELSKSICKTHRPIFLAYHVNLSLKGARGRLIQAGFGKWNFKKAVKRSKVHAPAFTCFSCPCEFVLQHLCYWAQNSKASMFLFQPTASQFWSLVHHYKGSRGITKFSLCKYIISTYYLFSFPGKLFFIISPHTARLIVFERSHLRGANHHCGKRRMLIDH